MPRLALRGIEKRFGGVVALAGADFSAEAGEIHGLCGENGAGKSTLLKILAGVWPHGSYAGQVLVDGVEQRLRSTADARRAGIAIVHQELMLVPQLGVAANLCLGREPRRAGLLDDLAVLAEGRALLDRFGLGREIDAAQPVGELGIGKQQMVEIVRALAADAKILVLDEPTAALAADECERLMAWLRDLRARGTTCIYVSHRMDEVFALCDRITVLRDGRTAGTLTAAEAKPAKVVAMMVGREIGVGRAATPAPERRGAPALEVEELSVGAVLRGVSLAVHPGELVAVCGAMGSGRTALLSTLFGGARAPVSGVIRLAGEPVRLSCPADAIACGVAFVPEDRKGAGLVPGGSVRDNLALPARGGLFSPVDDLAEEAEAAARIARLRLRGQSGSEVATLSGGNQQKVVIGKWLGRPLRVLLLDEPTRGVDVGAREEIYGIVAELLRAGTAVLMASSDLQEVLRLSHRIVVLRKGRVAGELDGERATQPEIVSLSTGASAKAALGGAECA